MTKPFSSLNVSDGLNRQEIYLQPEQSFRAYEVYLQASDARVYLCQRQNSPYLRRKLVPIDQLSECVQAGRRYVHQEERCANV